VIEFYTSFDKELKYLHVYYIFFIAKDHTFNMWPKAFMATEFSKTFLGKQPR
jgi:hypothetical protein